MTKPLHKHLTEKDKRDHFWSELGTVRQRTKKSNDELYRQNYDKIFNKSASEEIPQDENTKQATQEVSETSSKDD